MSNQEELIRWRPAYLVNVDTKAPENTCWTFANRPFLRSKKVLPSKAAKSPCILELYFFSFVEIGNNNFWMMRTFGRPAVVWKFFTHLAVRKGTRNQRLCARGALKKAAAALTKISPLGFEPKREPKRESSPSYALVLPLKTSSAKEDEAAAALVVVSLAIHPSVNESAKRRWNGEFRLYKSSLRRSASRTVLPICHPQTENT